MSKFKEISEQLNSYINAHGKIPPSSYIKTWHDHTNEYWMQVFEDALEIHNDPAQPSMKPWVVADIERLAKLVNNHGDMHPNILNPEPEDTARLQRALTHFDRTTTVKTVFWRTMMRLREYWCQTQGIDLPNDDSSKGKLNLTHNDLYRRMFE